MRSGRGRGGERAARSTRRGELATVRAVGEPLPSFEARRAVHSRHGRRRRAPLSRPAAAQLAYGAAAELGDVELHPSPEDDLRAGSLAHGDGVLRHRVL